MGNSILIFCTFEMLILWSLVTLSHILLHHHIECKTCFEARKITILAVALQLDAAAPVLASLKEPIVIAKVNADKFTRLAVKYDIEYGSLAFYFHPTLK